LYVTSPKSLLFCCFVTFAQKLPGLKVGYKSTKKSPQALLLLTLRESWNQLPWHTKSILVIENFLKRRKVPCSALFCGISSFLLNVHHEPKIPEVRPQASVCGRLP